MPNVELQIVRADGSAAADALVSVAEAPVDVTDVGRVADASGRLSIEVTVAGDYLLSVWVDGGEQRVRCRLEPASAPQVVRLPA